MGRVLHYGTTAEFLVEMNVRENGVVGIIVENVEIVSAAVSTIIIEVGEESLIQQ